MQRSRYPYRPPANDAARMAEVSVNPLAKKYAQLTPFNYASNNPINDLDVDGMQHTKTNRSPPGGRRRIPFFVCSVLLVGPGETP